MGHLSLAILSRDLVCSNFWFVTKGNYGKSCSTVAIIIHEDGLCFSR